MKFAFWLLDINSEIKDDLTELWLWGIRDNGERVLIIDKFNPYFYVVTKDGINPQNIAEHIRKVHGASIVKMEVVPRKFFGKPLSAIKVYCGNTVVAAKLAKELRMLEGIADCLEDDFRVSMQYLICNNVVPCRWHEINAVEDRSRHDIRANKVYLATSAPKLLERKDIPSFRILGFSIICYGHEGAPKPEKDPIVLISTTTENGEEKQFVANENRHDKHILEQFLQHIIQYNPDIIVSYGGRFNWYYIKERCHKLGISACIDRTRNEPHTSVYGHVSLTGIINLDLADFADEFSDLKVKTLQNLAAYLGIMDFEEQTLIDEIDFASYWDDKEKRELLKKFNLDNARRVKGAVTALLGFAVQLSSLVSLPLDHVMTAAVGFRIEWFLIKHAQKLGELVPKRLEQAFIPYAGSIVLTPQSGLHENIAVLDFKSMYPNIMIKYNLSPDTYVPPDEKISEDEVFEAPEVKHRFRKAPLGFYNEALSYLLSVRKEIQTKMRTLDAKSIEYQVLDARQKAIKVITNAAYGYAGWIGARWYRKPVAEAASAWGRYMIRTAIELAADLELKVVYGDTDSIFVTYDEKKTLQLERQIKQKLGLDVERSKIYVRVFFTEAKKRYAGLLPNGSIDVVGLEVIRGDWAEVARKVQERVLEIILKDQSVDMAVDFVQGIIADLKQKKVPFRDLIIWKTLTRPIEEYKVKAAHVEAAKILARKGWTLTVGDKVGYVVSTNEGRLYDKAKPYAFTTYNEVDIDYYVSKQVVPAAARILEFFGVNEKELLKPAKKGSLLNFMQ
ncbi:MAG: DNA polymerase domain-containing protein [Candidatus Bathyarchaeia archaeon]